MGGVCLTKQKFSMVPTMILVALFILFAGCIPKSPMYAPPPGKIENSDLISELNLGIPNQYPIRFKAVHHVALTLLGKTYVLNGYLTVNRLERQIHLIAQNDMGGTLFEIHTQGGETSIQSTTKFLKPSWLEKSVLKDLENLYLNTPLPSPALSQGSDNLFLLSESREGICRKYLFKEEPIRQNSDQNNYKLMGYKQSKNRKEIYAIAYTYENKNTGKITEQYPSFIAIEDHNLHYQLKINIQYFIPPGRDQGEKR
jgi:hypothetical protein